MSDILITKLRTGGQQMVRADTKNVPGHCSWMNVSEHGVDKAIELARYKSAEYEAIAADLEACRAQGVDW